MRSFNTLKKWPYIHLCLLDLDCWCEWWLYGAPLRLHFKKKHWEIPGPLRWISNRKSEKIFSGPGVTRVGVTGTPGSSGPGPSTRSAQKPLPTQEDSVVGG